jgi:hypothetical protein
MSLFLTSLLLVIDQDANSMCCAVGLREGFCLCAMVNKYCFFYI